MRLEHLPHLRPRPRPSVDAGRARLTFEGVGYEAARSAHSISAPTPPVSRIIVPPLDSWLVEADRHDHAQNVLPSRSW